MVGVDEGDSVDGGVDIAGDGDDDADERQAMSTPPAK